MLLGYHPLCSHNIPALPPPPISPVSRHQVPISQMGNYQEHLKRFSPLREVDSGAVRTQLFGNPFKLEKVWSLSCDCHVIL